VTLIRAKWALVRSGPDAGRGRRL